MKAILFVVFALIGWCPELQAASSIAIHNGFLTGEQYRNEGATDQIMYSIGLVDGMLVSPLFGAPDTGKAEKLGKCTEGMSGSQIVAILNKHLNDHPEEWNQPMHAIAFRTFRDVCKFND